MKKQFTLLILMVLAFYVHATDFTVTTKADDGSSGSFAEIFNSARNYGAENRILFADDIDTVYISRTYISREVFSNLIIDGQRPDGSKIVFYFKQDNYWHLFGNSHVQLKNIEFANDEPCNTYSFNLQSDNSTIKTSAMLSADFSRSGQLTVDNCTFNYVQSEYFSHGGALLCFGDDNVVKNSQFNFSDYYAFAEKFSTVQPKGNLLYMQGSKLDNCEFSGASILRAESINLTGGVAYCRVDSITNCKFNQLRIEMNTPDISQAYAPYMQINGGILYAENALIVNCAFNDNEIISSLHEAHNNATECMTAKGGILYATQYSEIISCKINNNEISLKVFDHDYPYDATKAKSYSTIKGGALYFTGGHPITKTYIQNNKVEAKRNSYGAGVYLDNAYMNTCLISDNKAIHLGYGNGTTTVYDTDGFVGGGIYATAGSNIKYSTIVKNSTQNGNTNTYNKGGGLASETNNDVNVWGCIFWRNSYKNGIIGEYDTYPMPNNMQYSASMGDIPSDKQNIRLSWTNKGENTATIKFANFIDPDNGNYKIGGGSACINKVWEEALPTDILGRDKRNTLTGSAGENVDCGAYEFYYGSSYQGGRIYVTENGTGYGSSWEDATSELNDVLNTVPVNSDWFSKAEIWVAEGTYYPSQTDVDETFELKKKKIALYGGFAGNETALEQRDFENNISILSGNLPGGGNTKTLLIGDGGLVDGFTVTGASERAIYRCGNIVNCKITGNNTTSQLINTYTDTIQNCSIYNNTISGGEILYTKNFISDVSIYNNTINCSGYSKLVSASENECKCYNLKICNNNVNFSFTGSDDVTLYSMLGAFNVVQNAEISSNKINFLAGGTIPALRFQIRNFTVDSLINSTICNNSISIDNSYTDLSVVEIIKDFRAKYLANTVIWNNTTSFTESDVKKYESIFILNGSVHNSAYDCTIANATPQNSIILASENTGSDASKNYPEFSDPANGEYWVTSTSALVDAGSNDYVSDITTDIEGNQRIYNSTVDIGAHEYKPYVIPDANGIAYIKENGTGDGSSWENAASNLARALPVEGIQQIWVAAGTYYPTDTENRNKSFVIPNGIKVYGGFTGTESSIDERDISLNETILSGDINPNNDEDAYTVVFVETGADENTIIDGFTIRDGNTTNASPEHRENIFGVGIYNNGALIQNCVIVNNTVFCESFDPGFLSQIIQGAGIYNIGGTIQNCEIQSNTVELDYYDDYNVSGGMFRIAISGTGIYNSGGGEVRNCLVQSNTITGIANAMPSKFLRLDIKGSGIYSDNGSVLHTILKNNYSLATLYSKSVGNVRHYVYGAGLYADNSTVSNCMFKGNLGYANAENSNSYGYSYGAALYAANSEVINCTMASNWTSSKGEAEAENLGSVYLNNSALKNCIVWNAPTITETSLINDGGTVSYTAVRDSLFTGEGNIKLDKENTGSDPALNYVAFKDVGANLDLSLLQESACINAGNKDYVSASKDLDGNTRIQGASVDMGAYERTVYTVSGTLTGANTVKINVTGDRTEEYTISDGESYSLYVEGGINLVITPSKNNYRFNPVNYELTNINEDITTLDFTAILLHSVVFIDWDGTELLAAQQVDHGSAATAPASNPTRTGYTFTGWDVDFSNVTSDLTVTAQYSPVSYSITYNLDGGTNHASNPTNYTIETETITLADATKANHSFEGWFSEAAFTNQIIEIAKGSTGNVALFAKWAINTYSVTFVDWDGTELLAAQQVNHGAAATAPANDPTRTGYTFTGWDIDFSNVTSNLTVTAQYEKNGVNNYTVTFADWNGSVIKTQTVAEGDAATAPADPTRIGYTFTGWDTDFSNVTSDLTVTAQYDLINYTITYNLDGGTNDVSNPVSYTIETATIKLADATKDGNTFGGWFNDAAFATQVTEIAKGSTGNINLFAKWLTDAHIVIFVDWDGTELKQENVDHGTAASAPANPTRAGYTFVGWDVDFSNITTDLTVTAQYEQNGVNNYTVTFIDWDETVLSTQIIAEGNDATAPVDPSRTGYDFTSWDVDFSNITSDLTVTAQYNLIDYSISYNLDGGTNDASNPSVYTIETATITLADATKTGYAFDGWYSDAALTNQITEIAKGNTGDVTLFAKWAIITYTITYYLDGGSNSTSNPDNYTIETEDIVLANAEKDGYSFIGWFTDEDFSSQISEIAQGTSGDINLYAKWDKTNAVEGIPTIELSVYPNPVSTNLSISIENLDQNTNDHITIYSISGSIIYQEKIHGASFTSQSILQIDLNQWQPGLYFIKVGKQVKKIIKE